MSICTTFLLLLLLGEGGEEGNKSLLDHMIVKPVDNVILEHVSPVLHVEVFYREDGNEEL